MVSPMNSMQVICILGVSLLLKAVIADVFTAVIKMECLVKVEKKMLNALDVYIEESQKAKEVVPESIVPFLSMARLMNEDAHQPHFIENPINAFHFMRRMAADWNRVISDINCDECIETPASKHLNISLTAIKKGSAGNYAGEVDQMGTALALVRLWHTYRLDLAALFRGEIYNTTTYPLSADDVYYICRLLNERQSYYKEILWLDEFTKQIDNGCYKGKTTPARAYKALAGAYFAVGMPWKSEDILAQYLINDPDNKSVKRDMRFYGERTKAIPPQDRIGVIETSEIDIQKSHYEALCRGDVVRPINVTSKLKCFMKPTVNPLLFAKEEVLNYDPRVSMYYDVITEKEELFIKDMVMNKMVRSTVVGKDDFNFDDGRVSQTAWLHDTLSPIIDKFTSRIQVLTGLSTQLFHSLSHAEELQVLNYGIGGMYEPHVDWFGYPIKTLGVRPADPPMLKGTGDRLATWLTYLNSVEAGGSTVFTDLDITVPVVKRAAAFWYNVKRTGECDVRTTHAGCPVLIGSKWAANKWIRETGNLFRRRCGSTPSSLDEPLS